MIDPALMAAYRAARYEVIWPRGRQALRHGEAVALPAGVGRLGIVTPDNPAGRRTGAAETAARRRAFAARVHATGCRWVPSEGHDPGGSWPVERGAALLDLADATLDALMRAFEQDAALIVPAGAPAHLRLHPDRA